LIVPRDYFCSPSGKTIRGSVPVVAMAASSDWNSCA
jgi:hypothetical protein